MGKKLKILGYCILLFPLVAIAQSVALRGVSGNNVLLSVDGSPPRFIREGKKIGGVKIEKVFSNHATFSIGEDRFNLSVGDTRANSKGKVATIRQNQVNTSTRSVETITALARHSLGKTTMTIQANTGGHFLTTGKINQKSVRFLVDTGATTIAMNTETAKLLGVEYEQGTKISSNTANGTVPGYLINLKKVSVGDIVLKNVSASVLESEAGDSAEDIILLGMSFLSQLKLTTEKNILTLEKE